MLTDWKRRLSDKLECSSNKIFAGDSIVSRVRNGLDPGQQPVPGNQSSLILSERGPTLKVFWSCCSGMGA
jgi:hypothetical protein